MGPTPRYFLIAILDIVGSGHRSDPDQAWLRQRMYQLTRRALTAAGIDSSHVEDRGDGILLLLPAGVPKPILLGTFVDALEGELREHARQHREGARALRLRAALHAGEVAWDGRGWVGADLNAAFRMVDLPDLRRTLDAAPKGVLAVGVSDALYQAVVRHDYPGIDPVAYRSVRFSAKEMTDHRLWIRVPGYVEPPGLDATGPGTGRPADARAEDARPTAGAGSPPHGAAAPAPPAQGGIGTVHGGFHHGAIGIAHREVRQTWNSGGPGSGELDLKRELVRLREELTEAHRRQQIDEETYREAGDELDAAEQNSPPEDEAGRGRLLRALRKFRALVEDVGGLTTAVTALVGALAGRG